MNKFLSLARWRPWLIVVVLLVVGCSRTELVCEDSLGCIIVTPNEPVRLGYLLATSQGVAFLGSDSLGGIEIALDDRNNELLGHRLELVGEDSGCTAVQGAEAARLLTAVADLSGIIGPNCANAAAAAIPIVNETGTIMISPSATAPRLTDPEGVWQPGFYRTAHNTNWQGRVAAEFAYEGLEARTAAVIGVEQNAGITTAFVERFEALNGRILWQRTASLGQTNFNDILNDIRRSEMDILYLSLFLPEAEKLISEINTLTELDDIVLLGPDSLLVAEMAQNQATAVNNIYISGPAVSGTNYKNFRDKWDSKYRSNPPGNYHAHAYDATNMLLDGIEMVAQVGGNNTLLIGRQALRDAVAQTVNNRGVTGRLNCQETGECASGQAIGVYKFSDSENGNGLWPPQIVWQSPYQ